MRLLTHLLLGHVRGRCHRTTLAAQHGWPGGRIGSVVVVVVEAVTVGMLGRVGVRAACGETREQLNAWKEKRDQCKCSK